MNEIKQNPLVSVILTVYNREKLLTRCIDSLLNQSFKDWELIAVDDGSTDNSYDILKSYASFFDNIHVFKQTNKKIALSRNRAIDLSNGKYITFIDSDDEYSEDHLEKRIRYMKAHPEIDLIHGGFEVIGDEFVRDKNNPDKFIHLSECIVGGTFFGKRNVFMELDGFRNLNYSEDSDFYERAEKKFNIDKVEFNTYRYYRDIPDSLTNKYLP